MSNIVIGPYDCTPEQFAAVRESLTKAGVNLPDGNSGVVEQSGIRAEFAYGGDALLVKVTDWPMGEGWIIESRLKKAIESAINN